MDARRKLVINLAARHDQVHTDAKSIVAGYIQGIVSTRGLVDMLLAVSKRYKESADLLETILKDPNSGLD
jgi:hypothetical protein